MKITSSLFFYFRQRNTPNWNRIAAKASSHEVSNLTAPKPHFFDNRPLSDV